MAQPTKPAAKKRAAKKPPVVKTGKKTQLYTEAQWKELENSHENYRKVYLDQVGELEKMRIELNAVRKENKEFQKAFTSDMDAEVLIYTVLKQRSPNLRAFILNRVAQLVRFNMESQVTKTNEAAKELQKRADETWNEAGVVQHALGLLPKEKY